MLYIKNFAQNVTVYKRKILKTNNFNDFLKETSNLGKTKNKYTKKQKKKDMMAEKLKL